MRSLEREYEVAVSRTVTQVRRVTVKAGSKAEAESKALETAGDLDFHDGTTGDPEYGVEAGETKTGKAIHSRRVLIRQALEAFCDDIGATGGVVKLDDGNHAPVADDGWTDLADTYLKACKALGREPRIGR